MGPVLKFIVYLFAFRFSKLGFAGVGFGFNRLNPSHLS